MVRIERLVTAEGEPLPEEEWPNVPGARVQVVKEWVYPEDEYDDTDKDGAEASEQDEEYEPAEPYQQYVPAWVVTDLDASGLRRRGQIGAGGTGTSDDGESEEEAEARREERRRVIANNKAWASAMLTEPVNRKVDENGGSQRCGSLIGWNCSRGGHLSRWSPRSSSAGLLRCRTLWWTAAVTKWG